MLNDHFNGENQSWDFGVCCFHTNPNDPKCTISQAKTQVNIRTSQTFQQQALETTSQWNNGMPYFVPRTCHQTWQLTIPHLLHFSLGISIDNSRSEIYRPLFSEIFQPATATFAENRGYIIYCVFVNRTLHINFDHCQTLGTDHGFKKKLFHSQKWVLVSNPLIPASVSIPMIDGPASSKINSFSRRASFLSLSRSFHATHLRRELGNLLWSLHGEWDCHKRGINIPWLKTNIYIYTYCRFYTSNIHVFDKFNMGSKLYYPRWTPK